MESKRLRRLRRRCLVVQSYVRRFLARRAYNVFLTRVVSCQRLWRVYRKGGGWPGKGDIERLKARGEFLERKMELLDEEGLR